MIPSLKPDVKPLPSKYPDDRLAQKLNITIPPKPEIKPLPDVNPALQPAQKSEIHSAHPDGPQLALDITPKPVPKLDVKPVRPAPKPDIKAEPKDDLKLTDTVNSVRPAHKSDIKPNLPQSEGKLAPKLITPVIASNVTVPDPLLAENIHLNTLLEERKKRLENIQNRIQKLKVFTAGVANFLEDSKIQLDMLCVPMLPVERTRENAELLVHRRIKMLRVRRFAIVIACQQYEHLAQLSGADTNASHVAQLLHTLGFNVLPPLIDPTRDQVCDLISLTNKELAKIDPCPTLLVYFCGRGFTSRAADTQDFVLCPSNFTSGSLPGITLLQLVNSVRERCFQHVKGHEKVCTAMNIFMLDC